MNIIRYKLSSILPILLALLLVVFLYGCNRKQEPITKSGFYFDTIIQITLYHSEQEHFIDECLSMADTYEQYFSATLPQSDVSKINDAKGAPVEVHEETIALLEKGLYYSELSQGGFDITLGALSSLWNFGHNDGILPTEQDIQAALTTIGYPQVKINGTTVSLTNPDTKIDLGGIAKGYIADQMKAYLTQNGVTKGIINLGGNVLCLGPKASGTPYRIGIQKPFAEDGTPIATVEVTDQTVVSSGIYERYFYVGDTLYHHILNPATGYPYNNSLTGITIICNDSVDGDGLSTTCFSLGLEQGMALIESLPDTEAIFITKDNQIQTSSGIGTTIPYTLYKP